MTTSLEGSTRMSKPPQVGSSGSAVLNTPPDTEKPEESVR